MAIQSRRRLWAVVDDDGDGMVVEADNGDGENVRMRVDFGEPTLVVDPTDEEVELAEKGHLPTGYTGNNLAEAIEALRDFAGHASSPSATAILAALDAPEGQAYLAKRDQRRRLENGEWVVVEATPEAEATLRRLAHL